MRYSDKEEVPRFKWIHAGMPKMVNKGVRQSIKMNVWILEKEKARGKRENSLTIVRKNLLDVEDGSGPLQATLRLSKGWVVLMSSTYGGLKNCLHLCENSTGRYHICHSPNGKREVSSANKIKHTNDSRVIWGRMDLVRIIIIIVQR